MAISDLITLGIGTPSTLVEWMLVGLSPAGSVTADFGVTSVVSLAPRRTALSLATPRTVVSATPVRTAVSLVSEDD